MLGQILIDARYIALVGHKRIEQCQRGRDDPAVVRSMEPFLHHAVAHAAQHKKQLFLKCFFLWCLGLYQLGGLCQRQCDKRCVRRRVKIAGIIVHRAVGVQMVQKMLHQAVGAGQCAGVFVIPALRAEIQRHRFCRGRAAVLRHYAEILVVVSAEIRVLRVGDLVLLQHFKFFFIFCNAALQ